MGLLITFFLDYRNHPLARRWVGLLVVELLETKENRLLFEAVAAEKGEFQKAFGRIIVEGMHKALKIVAGMIIYQLLQEVPDYDTRRVRLKHFMPAVSQDASENSQEFPVTSEGSQWQANFSKYVTALESMRERRGLQ